MVRIGHAAEQPRFLLRRSGCLRRAARRQNGDIRAIILNGRGIYPDGTLVLVPHTKLQAKYGNPLDKVILFIGANGQPICLIPKVGT